MKRGTHVVTRQESGSKQVSLGPAGSVWVLDFVWERFHNMSLGDFESAFIKAGESETKEWLRVEEAIGESLSSVLLWLML